MTDTVRVELLDDGRIARVVLAAGKGNVIGLKVIQDLEEVLGKVGETKSLCAIVLDHEGDHFSFGASVDEHVPGEVEKMLPRFHGLAGKLLKLRVPVLGVVRGMCLGGGLEVAILADRIFAAPGRWVSTKPASSSTPATSSAPRRPRPSDSSVT